MTAEEPEKNGEAPGNGAIVAVDQVKSAGAIVPVSGVTSHISEEQIKEAQKIATHTKALGIILPPPDIRQIIDKTAQFVARNGLEFERKILGTGQNNVKFNFLIPTDAYHPYYKLRIKEFSEGEKGGEGAKKDGPDAGATPAAAVAAAAAAVNQLVAAPAPTPAHAITGRQLEEPEKEKYTLHVPEGLTMYDLDIMKLTAQFVARNGKDFLTGLVQREQSNPQFQFLKPLNSLHQFFITMTNAYFEVLNPPRGYKQKLIKDGEEKSQILDRCLKRLEWDKAKAREAKEAADELERERMAMAAIDWHDFTVVETIDFLDEEDADLPPPMSLKDVIALNKARAFEDVQEEAEEDGADAPDAEDMVMDEEERQLVAEGAAAETAAAAAATTGAADEGEAAAPLPAPATAAPAVDVSAAPAVEDEDDDEPTGPLISGAVKRVMTRPTPAGYDPTKFLVSPITGELVPIAEMAEHMRISLIDPKWREQKDAMLAKFRDTTKASDDEITRNLVGLAKTRPDIFGSTDEEVSQAVSHSIKEKLMSGTGRPVVWDGQTKSGAVLDNQMKQIQDSKQDHGKKPDVSKPMMPTPILGPPPVRPMGNMPPPSGGSMGIMRPQQAGGAPPYMPPPPRPAMTAPPMRPPQQGFPGMGPPAMAPPMRPPPPQYAMPPPPSMLPPGMPPPPGAPALPLEAPPPMPEDEPDPKRPRLDFVLEAEEDFLLKFPGSSKVRVQCPEVEGNEKLIGQLLEVEVASLTDTILHLKDRLSNWIGVPANKMSLRRDGVGFIKDETDSLAHYNVSPDVILTLNVKERGGRKKEK